MIDLKLMHRIQLRNLEIPLRREGCMSLILSDGVLSPSGEESVILLEHILLANAALESVV